MEVFEIEELVLYIGSFLDVKSFVMYASTNTLFYRICNEDMVWSNKVKIIFGSEVHKYKPLNEIYKQQFIRIYNTNLNRDEKSNIPLYLNHQGLYGSPNYLIKGELDTLILYNQCKLCPISILENCAGYGHVHILDYYYKLSLTLGEIENIPSVKAYGKAVATGQIAVLDWLCCHDIPVPHSDQMDFSYGVDKICMLSTLILKYKYFDKKDLCIHETDESYKLSVKTYEWLLDHGLAIDEWMYCEAGSVGNIYMLDFLEQKGCVMQNVTLDSTCSAGSIRALEWFAKRNILPSIQDVCEAETLDVIKWVISHGIGPDIEWIKYSFCSRDDTSILDYFETLNILPDVESANMAYQKRAVKYLYWMKKRGIIPTQFNKVNKKRH